MEEIIKDAFSIGVQVTDSYAIYKGLVFYKDGTISSANTDYYKPLKKKYVKKFKKKGFRYGVSYYLADKYKAQLDAVEQRIKNEIGTDKNHKKIQYLKQSRINIINKYNEQRQNID
jgi:hypothetical protein